MVTKNNIQLYNACEVDTPEYFSRGAGNSSVCSTARTQQIPFVLTLLFALFYNTRILIFSSKSPIQTGFFLKNHSLQFSDFIMSIRFYTNFLPKVTNFGVEIMDKTALTKINILKTNI